ncbi:MAG: sigma factor [Planctomycetaceae bacterium]
MNQPHPPSNHRPDLEQYRTYLQVLAELHLAPELRGRVDASDIVQHVMLKADAAVGDLKQPDPKSLKAWLRTILTNELVDAFKFHHRNRRDVDRERSIAAGIDQSAAGLDAWLAAARFRPNGPAVPPAWGIAPGMRHTKHRVPTGRPFKMAARITFVHHPASDHGRTVRGASGNAIVMPSIAGPR